MKYPITKGDMALLAVIILWFLGVIMFYLVPRLTAIP